MRRLLLTAGWTILTATAASGQVTAPDEATERAIRALEQAEVDALLRGDLDGVARNWADDYTVNDPRNEVGRAADGPIRAGTRTYSSFVREIERVLIHGGTVIVMGSETVVPSGGSPDAGEIIRRRFTNVWMMREGPVAVGGPPCERRVRGLIGTFTTGSTPPHPSNPRRQSYYFGGLSSYHASMGLLART